MGDKVIDIGINSLCAKGYRKLIQFTGDAMMNVV